MSYEDLVRMVFESESARRASLGRDHHRRALAGRSVPAGKARFRINPDTGTSSLAATCLTKLLDFIRSLRPVHKTGLISNAWTDARLRHPEQVRGCLR